MKTSGLFLLLFLSLPAYCQPTFRIAFGSCSEQGDSVQLWREVVATQPDLWIWGGDNIYGDTKNLSDLANYYTQQKNRPSYQQLLATCPVTGTWDDHDYGTNDGGKYFSIKKESKALAANFLGFKKENPLWLHEGLYNSLTVTKGKFQLKVINLDTRYFRDTVIREYVLDPVTHQEVSRYRQNPTGDVLGEEQWKWLEDELKNSTADLYLLNSSIQVVAQDHRFEKWSNFPSAHKRLYALLAKYPHKKVVILSGDRHISELSKRDSPSLPYPLYDFTCSGLTHTWSEVWEEENQFRLGKLIIEKNFGLLEIAVQDTSLRLTFSTLGANRVVYQKIEAQLR